MYVPVKTLGCSVHLGGANPFSGDLVAGIHGIVLAEHGLGLRYVYVDCG